MLTNIMRTMSSSAAKAKFCEALACVRYSDVRVTITSYGRPVAALVSIADLEAIEGKTKKRAPARRRS